MISPTTVCVVDDDEAVRDSVQALLESSGYRVEAFPSALHLLDKLSSLKASCLVADIRMPKMTGLELQHELAKRGVNLPIIFITGHGDISMAVTAMKAGSADFIEKPFDETVFLESVRRAASIAEDRALLEADRKAASQKIDTLSEREREVLRQLVAGRPNKVVAFKLNISSRTVEVHRARIMEKLQVRSLSDVVRASLAAGIEPATD